MAATRNEAFTRDLLAWFAKHQRPLPWRTEPRDPFATWLAEVMLQQTQVATATPFFERFLARWPTVDALAKASEVDVLKAWEGLGYYSRARRLLAAARVVADGGGLPRSRDALARLPGFGPYTAGAVASLAFGARVAAVDGNVMRVLARFDADGTDVAKPASRARFERRAVALQDPARPGAFNEALMELGALVCTPRAPRCDGCPVRAGCRAHASGRVAAFPVKTPKARPRPERLVAAVAVRGPRVFLARPEHGLVAGLFAPPVTPLRDGTPAETIRRHVADAHGLVATADPVVVGDVTHTYTHRAWRVAVAAVHVTGRGHAGAWRPLAGDAATPLAGWAKKALKLAAQV